MGKMGRGKRQEKDAACKCLHMENEWDKREVEASICGSSRKSCDGGEEE